MVLAKDINSLFMGGQMYTKNLAGKTFNTKNSSIRLLIATDYLDGMEYTPQGQITVEGSFSAENGEKYYMVSGKFHNSDYGTTQKEFLLTENQFKSIIK